MPLEARQQTFAEAYGGDWRRANRCTGRKPLMHALQEIRKRRHSAKNVHQWVPTHLLQRVTGQLLLRVLAPSLLEALLPGRILIAIGQIEERRHRRSIAESAVPAACAAGGAARASSTSANSSEASCKKAQSPA